MSRNKEYRYDERKPLSKQHKLVAAAYQKGLTGIKISWYHALNYGDTGWVLESDQIKYMRLGLGIDSAIVRIKNCNPIHQH